MCFWTVSLRNTTWWRTNHKNTSKDNWAEENKFHTRGAIFLFGTWRRFAAKVQGRFKITDSILLSFFLSLGTQYDTVFKRLVIMVCCLISKEVSLGHSLPEVLNSSAANYATWSLLSGTSLRKIAWLYHLLILPKLFVIPVVLCYLIKPFDLVSFLAVLGLEGLFFTLTIILMNIIKTFVLLYCY
jgi:hypothetical protein